jgi:hypothetical protein
MPFSIDSCITGPVVANLAQESRHGIETQLTEQVNGKEGLLRLSVSNELC